MSQVSDMLLAPSGAYAGVTLFGPGCRDIWGTQCRGRYVQEAPTESML